MAGSGFAACAVCREQDRRLPCPALRGGGVVVTLKSMGQHTPELPADTLVSAVDNAGRGVVTHITIKGDRVAAIVSQSTLAMSRLLTV